MNWRERWSRWQRPFGLLLGTFALALVASRLWNYRDEVAPALHHSRPGLLCAALLVAIVSQAFFAFGWTRLIEATGSRISRLDALSSWSTSLAAKYLPGKIWQAVVRQSMHGASGEAVLTLYVREQLVSVGTACLFVAMHAPPALPPTSRGPFQVLVLITGLALIGISMSVWLPRWIPARLRNWWQDCRPHSVVLVQMCLLDIVGYTLLAIGLAILLRGLSIEGGGLIELASGLCFGGLAGLFAFFIPAGLGAREAGLYWFLAPILGAGPAALVAIASRVWLITADCVLVAMGVSISMITHRVGASKP